MLKKPFSGRKVSAPRVSIVREEPQLLTCTIRFLDDSEPMTINFKVRLRGSD